MISISYAYGIVQELDFTNLLSKIVSDELTQQEKTNIGSLIMELFFAPFTIWMGASILKEALSRSRPERRSSSRVNTINSRERKLAYFNSQFGFYLLVIAMLISFTVQSMSEEDNRWMYFWGILSMIGIFLLRRYRDKELDKIFDDDYYT